MSQTTLDTNGTGTPDGGDETDQATLSQVEAAQALDESTLGITTHTGTVNAPFSFSYNGCILSYSTFEIIIADLGLYAALNASPTATANLTWNN
jgi:hypothetical protein